MARLTPCPCCTRHVKVGSSACPFCGGDVPIDVPVRPIAASRPLTRAAILFASAAAVTACTGAVSAAYGLFAGDAEIPPPHRDGGTADAGMSHLHDDSGATAAQIG